MEIITDRPMKKIFCFGNKKIIDFNRSFGMILPKQWLWHHGFEPDLEVYKEVQVDMMEDGSLRVMLAGGGSALHPDFDY